MIKKHCIAKTTLPARAQSAQGLLTKDGIPQWGRKKIFIVIMVEMVIMVVMVVMVVMVIMTDKSERTNKTDRTVRTDRSDI